MTISAEAVASFLHSRSARPKWLDVPDSLRPRSMEDGYALQKAVHKAVEAGGNKLLGYKVGATSKTGQRTYGIDEPIYGGLFASNLAPSLAEALSAPLIAPSLECEIAFRLGSDIDGSNPGLSLKDVAGAVSSCHIACEIIDNRYGDALALGVPSLLTDDFFQASFVIGSANSDWSRMNAKDLHASIEVDGTKSSGHSADVVDAFTALLWLARKLSRNGLRLCSGAIVMSGTIVRPVPVRLPVSSVKMSIDGFGSLTY